MRYAITFSLALLTMLSAAAQEQEPAPLKLDWTNNYLTISGEQLPGTELRIHYLEAYCRAGSTDSDWRGHTKMRHVTKLVDSSGDGTMLTLRCEVEDGLIVDHEIRSTHDEVEFRITAKNATDKPTEALWAQPCIRVDKFTGEDRVSYLPKCFVFLDGKLERMPTREWATEARYTPGQVWVPDGVDRNDVNPRPINPKTPSNGLIGCFSADETMLFAVAFHPYQELFQGIAACLHSDFRIGILQPGESRTIRGKIYILPNNVRLLLNRYKRDFPG